MIEPDETDQILHIIRNLSMVLEAKVKKNAKAQVEPKQMGAWLIKRLEQATQDIKALFE